MSAATSRTRHWTALAVVTSVVALAMGLTMVSRPWGTSLRLKVRIAFFVIAVQAAPALLFIWVFGIFALVHFSYGFVEVVPGRPSGALGAPILYAVAVSLYTVLNFAVRADLSTPRSVPVNAALGVALSGWTAAFLSTALVSLSTGALSGLAGAVLLVRRSSPPSPGSWRRLPASRPSGRRCGPRSGRRPRRPGARLPRRAPRVRRRWGRARCPTPHHSGPRASESRR